MAEFTLTPAATLGGAEQVEEHCRAWEVNPVAIASMAARRGAISALRESFSAAFGGALPDIGLRQEYSGMAIASAGYEQWFATSESELTLAENLRDACSGNAVITDQSGGWSEIRLQGEGARETLARLCPIDLHPEVFIVGSAQRTVMEHLGVQLALVDDRPTFSLLTPSSSAPSFWTALTHAMASTRPA
ncbi:MAG: hypothetical protein AAF458_20545 [Pseudomonadota bacterium]